MKTIALVAVTRPRWWHCAMARVVDSSSPQSSALMISTRRFPACRQTR
jgi:hypothetical protein